MIQPQTTGPQDARITEIHAVMLEVESLVKTIEDQTTKLQDRLGPVLAQMDSKGAPQPPRQARRTPLGQSTDAVSMALERISVRLGDILDRLEI